MKSNILFIINPIAGGRDKQRIPALIDSYLTAGAFAPVYVFTDYAGHAAELVDEAAQAIYDTIVAVGGDGTVNEIAGKLVGSAIRFGIIPLGSGNGLARTLGIPLHIKGAVNVINQQQTLRIDGALLNQRYFFNVAGLGFDARISAAFAGHKKRGLMGYALTGLRTFRSYEAQNYRIYIDDQPFEARAFILSIANSSQYGNNVFISPLSLLNDGLLEVCIIRPVPFLQIPTFIWSMWRSKKRPSTWVDIYSGKKIRIERPGEDAVHLDGEPLLMGKTIDIEIVPAALTVLHGGGREER